MGFWAKLFGHEGSASKGEPTLRGKRNTIEGEKVKVDRYTHLKDGKHVHEGYNLDQKSGRYKQYGGGENSGDRSYNKGSGGNKGRSKPK